MLLLQRFQHSPPPRHLIAFSAVICHFGVNGNQLIQLLKAGLVVPGLGLGLVSHAPPTCHQLARKVIVAFGL